MTTTAHLDDRAVVALSGPDAPNFLQGLITNDIRRLSAPSPLYAAILTPQGKILFDFLVFAEDDAILLDCPSATAEALVKRLALYRLRAKVDIARRDDLAVIVAWNGTVLGDAGADPRLAALGRRAVVDRSRVPSDASSADSYLVHRLELGVPEGADFGQDKMFALDADLDELNGVSFEKGCYVGQELTARMKHRGTARKRLLPVETADGSMLAPAGCSVTAGGRDLGEVVSTHGPQGFALLRLDRLAEAGEMQFAAGDTVVRVLRPQWLFS